MTLSIMQLRTADESPTSRLPLWLAAAAIVLVTQSLVSIGLDPQPIDLTRVALGLLLVALLLLGSRLAWMVLLLGTLYQIASSAVDDSQVRLVVGVAIALCLLSPSAIRYVWTAGVQHRPRWIGQRMLELYVRIRTSAYVVAARLVGWGGERDRDVPLVQRSYSAGLWRLGIGCLVLLLLGGLTVNWQERTGGATPVLNIAEGVVWIFYVVTQAAFLALAVLAMRSAVARFRLRRQQKPKSHRVT